MKLKLVFILLLSASFLAKANDNEFDLRLSNIKYPFGIQIFPFTSQNQDLELAYMHLKAKKGKATVVLFHSKDFVSSYWEQTARHLQEQDYGVLIIDQLGFGKSSKPTTYQYSFHALAKNTNKLITHLKLNNLILMGHGTGAMLATRFSLLYPNEVKKLVVINPFGYKDYLRYVRYQDISFLYQLETAKTIETTKNYQTKNFYNNKWQEKYQEQLEINIKHMQIKEQDLIALNRALFYDIVFTDPVYYELRYLKPPVSLIVGLKDKSSPGSSWKKENIETPFDDYEKISTNATNLIPNAKANYLADLGHVPFLENIEEFTKALDEALKEDKKEEK